MQTCLDSIRRQDGILRRIVVVDARDDDATMNLVDGYLQILQLMLIKAAPGLARQKNFGIVELLA